MQNKNIMWATLALVVILGFGAWYIQKNKTEEGPNVVIETGKPYSSDTHKIAFTYPAKYDLTERPLDIEDMKGTYIILNPNDVQVPVGGEGPPGITITVFENQKNTPLADFLQKATGNTPSPTGGFDFQETTIASKSAIAYTSTGLYESDNIAVANNGKVYIFSASWMTRDDQTLKDLGSIISSVQLN